MTLDYGAFMFNKPAQIHLDCADTATSASNQVWCPLIGAFQPMRCFILPRGLDSGLCQICQMRSQRIITPMTWKTEHFMCTRYEQQSGHYLNFKKSFLHQLGPFHVVSLVGVSRLTWILLFHYHLRLCHALGYTGNYLSSLYINILASLNREINI